MKIYRSRLMSIGVVFLFVFAVRAAAEIYDETPASDLGEDVIVMNDGFVDMESVVPLMSLDDPLKQLFLYKVMKSLGTNDDYVNAKERQIWGPFDDNVVPMANNELFKLSAIKRTADTKGVVVKPQPKPTRPTNKPPKKPKSRGRYIGSQFICYLKICNLLTKYNNKLQ